MGSGQAPGRSRRQRVRPAAPLGLQELPLRHELHRAGWRRRGAHGHGQADALARHRGRRRRPGCRVRLDHVRQPGGRRLGIPACGLWLGADQLDRRGRHDRLLHRRLAPASKSRDHGRGRGQDRDGRGRRGRQDAHHRRLPRHRQPGQRHRLDHLRLRARRGRRRIRLADRAHRHGHLHLDDDRQRGRRLDYRSRS